MGEVSVDDDVIRGLERKIIEISVKIFDRILLCLLAAYGSDNNSNSFNWKGLQLCWKGESLEEGRREKIMKIDDL